MASYSLASGVNTFGVAKAEATLQDAPKKNTLQPIVTGTTVLGLKYNGGVMLAADTLASYGSLARYKDMKRLTAVGENTIIGASGEMSDFQAIVKKIEAMENEDNYNDDGYQRSSSEIFNYLRAIMYQRRNKGNPLWNQLLVAGHKSGASFLGYVDLIGTCLHLLHIVLFRFFCF